MIARRHLRLASLLLTGLAGAGLLTVGFGLTPLSGSVFGSMLGLGPKGDFSITFGSNFLAVPQGSTGTDSITVTGLNHFTGDVSITATITTSANPPVVKPSQSSVKLSPEATASLSVTVSTTSSTTLGYYNITVQGKTGSLSHSITILAHVTPPPPPPTPDFSLYSNPSSLTTTQGAYVTATLTISSILSYSGKVVLTTSIYPSGVNSPRVSLNLTTLLLPAAGSNTTTIVVNAFNATAGYYTITVTGTSGTLNHTISVGLSVNPAGEALNFVSYAFSSSTNATLYIQNFGSGTTTLVSYYVVDANRDQYFLNNWNGPAIASGQLGIATILIGASCNRCVLTGSAFNFTQGNSYTIVLVTGRNNVFTFTIAQSSREHLGMDAFAFTSGTNLTMYIRNTGNVPVQLTAYYVIDTSGDSYHLTPYSGPTIPLTQVAAVYVAIGSSCPSCTLSGSAFTFMAGYSYTIILVTSTNQQFTFTVNR